MKRNLLVSVQALTASLMLSVFSGTVSAQETITLKETDFTVPAWTRLKAEANQATTKESPYAINMTLNGDPATRMAFAWFTNEGVADGKVQIVAKANATEADFAAPTLTLTAKATAAKDLNYLSASKNADVISATGIAANTKRSYTSHKALATGLNPNTAYSFRVGKEGNWSPIGSFKTAKGNKDAFSFIYVTDTQANTDEMFSISQKTIQAAHDTVSAAQFLLIAGDLVETSGASNSEWEWEQWFDCMQNTWYNLPIVPMQGNHDTSPNNNFALHFNTDTTFNQTAATAGTAMNGTVYSFVYGDALFMIVNYEDYKKEGYFNALAQWMEKQVNDNKNVKWRIACYHKNMFTGSKSHQSDSDGKTVRAAMLPVFDKLNIDLALQGHDHIYEVIGPVRNSDKTLVSNSVEHVEIIDGNKRENMTGKQGGTFNVTNGTLYFLNNSAGKKKYEPRNEQEMIDALNDHEVNNYWGLFSGKFGQTGEPTFSRVDVSTDQIAIKTYTVDNFGKPTLFDSFKVVKGTGTTAMETLKSEEISISPNPASGLVSVSGVNADKIELFSMSGELMLRVKSTNQFDVSQVASGIYIVKVTAENDIYTSKLSVK